MAGDSPVPKQEEPLEEKKQEQTPAEDVAEVPDPDEDDLDDLDGMNP